jgi:uncharacterized membrane protein
MAQARESLKGLWGVAIGTTIVYFILSGCGYIPLIGPIVSLILTGPLLLGFTIFSLSVSRKQTPQFIQLFDGFKKFGTALGAYLLQAIFIFLWTLLLIIPGIIAAVSYAMTFYILAENDIGPLQAIRKSKEMMRGNKWKLFCLGCRFIGWALLCILTLGIGFLWFTPYIMVSYAKFYDDLLKKEAGAAAN